MGGEWIGVWGFASETRATSEASTGWIVQLCTGEDKEKEEKRSRKK